MSKPSAVLLFSQCTVTNKETRAWFAALCSDAPIIPFNKAKTSQPCTGCHHPTTQTSRSPCVAAHLRKQGHHLVIQQEGVRSQTRRWRKLMEANKWLQLRHTCLRCSLILLGQLDSDPDFPLPIVKMEEGSKPLASSSSKDQRLLWPPCQQRKNQTNIRTSPD